MWTIIYVTIIIVLLYGAGILPARLLFTGDKSRLRYIAAPILGFGLTVILLQYIYWLGFPVKQQVPFFVGIMGFIFVADWYRGRAARGIPNVSERKLGVSTLVIAFGVLAATLCGWPGVDTGYKTYMAYANPDANNYQFMADRYLNYSIREPIVLDGYHPGNYHVNYSFASHERSGVDAYLAWVSGVCNTTTKEAFVIAICSLIFLAPLSVYLFAQLGLGMSDRMALMVSGATAASSLLGLIAYQQLLGNVGGACLVPATLGGILDCVRKAAWRTMVLTAVLCAALLSVYPEAFMMLGPVAACAVACIWLSRQNPNLIRNSVLSVGVATLGALVINPLYGYYGVQMLIRQSGSFPGADSYAFAFTRAILPVGFGLLPFPLAAASVRHLFLGAFRLMAFPIGALCIGALGICVWRRTRSYNRFAIGGGLMGILGLGLYLAVYLRYSYGFFKVIMYGEFLILAAVVAACMSMWENQEVIGGVRVRWFGGGLLALVLLWNLLSFAWYGAVSLATTNHGIVNEVSLSSDNSFNELEELKRVVAPSDSVMIDTSSGIVQMWTVYGLRELRVSLMQPLLYFEDWTRGGANDFTHDYGDRYVLHDTSADGDIIKNANRGDPIWRSHRFELYPFRDYVALGANWYALNRTGEYPWRWLNTDGEILLIRPSEKRYTVAFLCSPGPGVPGNVRHVQLLVNGQTMHEQIINATETVQSPLLPMDRTINRIVIRIVEKATLIPTDSRLLNVGIGKVQVRSEGEMKRTFAEEHPSEIASRTLSRYVSAMRNVYADAWVGPEAEISLGNLGDAKRLELDGEIPAWSRFDFPVSITVRINGVMAGTMIVKAPGKFSGAVDIPKRVRQADLLRVSLITRESFSGQELELNSDSRRLSFFFSAVRVAKDI